MASRENASLLRRRADVRVEVERLVRSCRNDEELVHGLLAVLADVLGEDHAAIRSLTERLGRDVTEPFAYGYFHDINNMLATARYGLDFAGPEIRRFLEQLMAEGLARRREIEEVFEALGEMDEAVTRVLAVVKEARELRGALEGKKAGARARLAELVAAATRLVARQHSGVFFRLENIPDVSVRATSVAVFRVLLNLLENACQAVHGREWREVRIRGWTSKKDAFVEVADTGPGIPESDQARVFYPSVTTKPKGSGMGLFLSRALVTDWGGQLQLVSQQGEGARFTFSAPLEEST